MDGGLILEKQRGLSAKSTKTGPRVDFKETQGLLCKMAGTFGWGFIFQRIKSWIGSTLPWTDRARSVHRGPMAARTEGGQGAVARSLGLGLRPLWCTKAHRRGRNRERRARGARLMPHRSSGGGVATGRRRWREEVTGNLVGWVSGAGEERRRAR
jgi:hypothetical protein